MSCCNKTDHDLYRVHKFITCCSCWKTSNNYLKDQFGREILGLATGKKSIYWAPSVCQEVTSMTSFYLFMGSQFTYGKTKIQCKEENNDMYQVCLTPEPIDFPLEHGRWVLYNLALGHATGCLSKEDCTHFFWLFCIKLHWVKYCTIPTFSSLKSFLGYIITTYHWNGREIIWFWAGQSGTGSWMDSHSGQFPFSEYSIRVPRHVGIIDLEQSALSWQRGSSSEMILPLFFFNTFYKISRQASLHLHHIVRKEWEFWWCLCAFPRATCIGVSGLRVALW